MSISEHLLEFLIFVTALSILIFTEEGTSTHQLHNSPKIYSFSRCQSQALNLGHQSTQATHHSSSHPQWHSLTCNHNPLPQGVTYTLSQFRGMGWIYGADMSHENTCSIPGIEQFNICSVLLCIPCCDQPDLTCLHNS